MGRSGKLERVKKGTLQTHVHRTTPPGNGTDFAEEEYSQNIQCKKHKAESNPKCIPQSNFLFSMIICLQLCEAAL